MKSSEELCLALLVWYDAHRRDLPWRGTHDPYRIWLSEIMLQQTRVETVKTYYARFLTLFPTVSTLAKASEQAVLKAWEGLGYYSRARNLHKAAKAVCEQYCGEFPREYDKLRALPGIGEYTAGAVGSIAFGLRTPAVDGNVNRVITRLYGIKSDLALSETKASIYRYAMALLNGQRATGDVNQALMELGATLCLPRSPQCGACPWASECTAHQAGDETHYPVHEKKTPPKEICVTVCLITYGNCIYIINREQRLLHHMNAFYLMEGEHAQTMPEIKAGLADAGFAKLGKPVYLGEAKHVFTHRVWNMRVYHIVCLDGSKPEQGEYITKQALLARPWPTALQYAKEQALRLLP